MFLVHTLGGGDPSNLSGNAKELRKLEGFIPINFLIHLWLGHKKVIESNFFVRLFYYDSFDKNFLLKIAKRFTLSEVYDNGPHTYGVEYVFGPHANVIIPALIEMGIFEEVVTQLLEEKKSSGLKRLEEVMMMISSAKILEIISGQDSFKVERILTWDPEKDSDIPKVDRSIGFNSGVRELSPKEHFLEIVSLFCQSVS